MAEDLRGQELVSRDARLEGRVAEADELLAPVLAAATDHARYQGRDDARDFRGDEAEAGDLIIEVREGRSLGDEQDALDITDALDIESAGWESIRDRWVREYDESLVRHLSQAIERTDPDLDSWLPRHAVTGGECAHCNDTYEQGDVVLTSDHGASIHSECWENHIGYLSAMGRD